jgi:hypothetical protein
MKTTVLVFFFLLCATAVFGQSASVLSNRPQVFQIPDNPAHASQHEMAEPQNILEHSGYTYAQGERPLWEFGPASQPVPLGDSARAFRKQHKAAKKSEIVWQN